MDPALDHALTLTSHALAPAWQAADAKGQLGLDARPEALARLYSTLGEAESMARLRVVAGKPGLPPAVRLNLLAILIRKGSVADAEFALGAEPTDAALADAWVETARLRPALDYSALVRRWLARPETAVRATACRVIAASGRDAGSLPQLEAWLAENTETSLRLAAISAYARTRGSTSWDRLAPLLQSNEESVRVTTLAALAPTAPAKAAENAATLLASCGTPAEAGRILAPVLEQKDGPAALATALGRTKPGSAAARAGLEWMAQVGQDNRPVVSALQAAAGVTGATLEYDAGLIARLVASAQANGDARRGAAIAHAPARACLACHRIDQEGGAIGPELSAIGRAMSKEAIVESVLWPKRQVKEGYMLTQVTTKSGRNIQGYRVAETAVQLTLRNFAAGGLETIPKAEIAARSDAGTIMPDGLTVGLSTQELDDLFAYLFQLGK